MRYQPFSHTTESVFTMVNAMWSILIWLFYLPTAFAAPLLSNSVTQTLVDAKARYGVTNFKMVMPGVLYRGGSNNSKTPLSTSSLQKLCDDNFDAAVYVYSKDWGSRGTQVVHCRDSGKLSYIMRRWDKPEEVHEILGRLYNIINNGKGAMYIHCWHGVHASGYVATVALMQFCNLSPHQGVAYWNSNVPEKLRYSKVQNMIWNFKPNTALRLTSAQQAQFCPPNLR